MITVLVSHTQWYIGSLIGSPQSWVGTRLHTAGAGATVLARVQLWATHIGELYLEQRVHTLYSTFRNTNMHVSVYRFDTVLKRWAHKPFWFFTSTTSVVCTGVGDLPTVNM